MSLSFTIVAGGNIKLEPECRSVEPTDYVQEHSLCMYLY